MIRKTSVVTLRAGLLLLLLAAGPTACLAQIDTHTHTVTKAMESHVHGRTGHAFGSGPGRPDAGAELYRRYCIGCHGPNGDGNGENAQWVDPRPRDFTLAVFKCRSTPTGTLPTDEDLFNNITRGFVTTTMPPWKPLTDQERANLIAMVKAFSPRWQTEGPGTPITIPTEPPATIESILQGRGLYDKMQCWKCHGPEGRGDGPSALTLTDTKGNPIRPYDFTTGALFKCGVTNHDLYRIFMTGLDGTPMPSFAENIKPEEAWHLVHFLRTLQVGIKTPERATFEKWASSHPGALKPIGSEQLSGEN
jgi:cytochrome c oxidase cbb3-type subunit 2